jgi:hypothetical protein
MDLYTSSLVVDSSCVKVATVNQSFLFLRSAY